MGVASRVTSPVGRLLQHWRLTRRKSQLALSLEAGVSSRHLSFVESGRSNPSREMVLTLAGALAVPLRERNALLVAAGYAPLYPESALEAPHMAQVRKALIRILGQQEPYPAVVMDRHWNLLMTNRAASRLFGLLLGGRGAAARGGGAANVLRLIFDPDALRPWVANWERVAEALVQRVHREAVGGVPDEGTARLLQELLAQPGVPPRWRTPALEVRALPFLPVEFRKGALAVRYFSTVTTLGTPHDVTAQEIRIECFFPADAATEAQAQRLADGAADG